jgi:SnoaL-like domain
MSDSPDVAAIRRLLAAFNRGDFSALDDVDPQAEFQDEPRIPGAGWNHGHSGAVTWAVKLWQAFGSLHLDIDEPVTSGGYLIARWRASGVGKRSGIPVDMRGYCVFCMRRAKVLRVEFFESEQAARERGPSSAACGRDSLRPSKRRSTEW